MEETQPRGPGRPPIGDRPMTPAERQRKYRRSQHRAVIGAIGNEKDASRAELMALLARDLGKLDRDPDHLPSRAGAQRVIKELVTRYGIGLTE